MARVCGKCLRVHPPEIGCENAKIIRDKDVAEFNRRVKHHEEHCRGCPNPAQHIRNLDELDNPRKEPIKYAKKVEATILDVRMSEELRKLCLNFLTKIAINNGVAKEKAGDFAQKALSLKGDMSELFELCEEYGIKGPTWPPNDLVGVVPTPFRPDGSGIDIHKNK